MFYLVSHFTYITNLAADYYIINIFLFNFRKLSSLL